MAVIPHFKVLVDCDSSEWISEPECVGSIDETVWNSLENDGDHQYKFYDMELRDINGQIIGYQFCALELVAEY